MQLVKNQSKWKQARGKKRPHWGILTLNDLPKTNGKYSQLIAQLQAQDKAVKELRNDQPKQNLEDFSI